MWKWISFIAAAILSCNLAHGGSADSAKVEACKEMVGPFLSGAQARYQDMPLAFVWEKPESLSAILRANKGWPTTAMYIRDDGETAEERSAFEAKLTAGWQWADERVKANAPPPDWSSEYSERMRRCVLGMGA